jgi:hypothetical protein
MPAIGNSVADWVALEPDDTGPKPAQKPFDCETGGASLAALGNASDWTGPAEQARLCESRIPWSGAGSFPARFSGRAAADLAALLYLPVMVGRMAQSESALPRRLRFAFYAASLLLVTSAGASAQESSELAYSRQIEALCRQYAAAISEVPAVAAFAQCMSERHCRPISDSVRYRCDIPGPLSWHGGGY